MFLLCNDILQYVFGFIHPSKLHLVSRKYHKEYKKKLVRSVYSVQRIYNRKRLFGDVPYNTVTLNTLKRFYVTKYRAEWLQDFPQSYARLMVYVNRIEPTDSIAMKYLFPSNKQLMGFTQHFLECCNDFRISQDDFRGWGW